MGWRIVQESVAVGVVSMGAALRCAWLTVYGKHVEDMTLSWVLTYGTLGIVLMMTSLISFDMAWQNPANSHSIWSLLKLYQKHTMARIRGRRHFNRIRRLMKEVKNTQEVVLSEIMDTQERTFYGDKFKFTDIETLEEYRAQVPLTSYKNYENYVERIAAGGRNVLTTERVVAMGTSSENSNGTKMIPIGWYTLKARAEINDVLNYLLSMKNIKLNLGKKLLLAYRPKLAVTTGGIPCGPFNFFMQPHFDFFVTPRQIFDIVDKKIALYINAVFGLAEKEVTDVLGTTSSLTLSFWKIVKEKWSDICDDIEFGKLSPDLALEPSMRSAFEKYLRPLPQRAALLRKEFQEGMAGISKRVWPSCDIVRMANAGKYARFACTLADSFMTGVHQHCPLHTCPEGIVGLNLSDTDQSRYTFLFEENLYEFIPEEHTEEENPPTYFLNQLEVGKKYEVVLTTRTGLYRYRLGEIIQISDKHDESPTYVIPNRL